MTVLHVKDAEAGAVGGALTDVLANRGWRLREREVLSMPPAAIGERMLQYAVSPRGGAWTTILSGHGYVQNEPLPQELADSISGVLRTYVLALSVVHSDILCYWLSQNGQRLNSYSSHPPGLFDERLSTREIAALRHRPESFSALMPAGTASSELVQILERGWWAAHNGGRLNADGLPPDDEPGFVFEDDRLTAVGNLLRLHGEAEEYPYAGWASDDSTVRWPGFQELRFSWEARG